MAYKTVHTSRRVYIEAMTEGSGQCLVKTGEKQLYAQLYLLGEQREKECVGFKGKKHNHKLSIVKTTKCTSFSNLFYFVVAFYLFRTVHHQESKTIHTVSGVCQTGSVDCLLAGTGWNCSAVSSICLTYICCCMYSLELLMMHGKTVRNMQSVILK